MLFSLLAPFPGSDFMPFVCQTVVGGDQALSSSPNAAQSPGGGEGAMEDESLPVSSTHVLFLISPYLLDRFPLLANAVRVKSVLTWSRRCR